MRTPRGGALLNQQRIEELFTQFEHYTALAQLALEELQDQSTSIRSAPALSSDVVDRPSNVVPFRAR